MPELPEVEAARRLAERVTRGRRITRVRCARDPIVFDGVAPPVVSRTLTGRRVLEVHRRGKHLWFELDRRPWPCFHFGMTGSFRTPDETPLKLASSPAREGPRWPPRFVKMHLFLSGGRELVVVNKRRLGRIRLRQDPAAEPPISRLGFDPLLDPPAPGEFRRRVAARRTPIKALLLDQSFAAGVGNWIADEVLYQSRIDPRRRADTLSDDEARRLHRKLRHVVETAVRVDADKSRLPGSWLFHHRWGKHDGARTARGERIRHITLAGRTTAWVPAVQR